MPRRLPPGHDSHPDAILAGTPLAVVPVVLKTLLLLLIPVPAHAGDRPTRGDARAVQAEREAFPQDTLTALRAGDAWLAVGAWSRAEQAYQVAFELSDGGAPARQGLALVRAARAPRGTITGGLTGSVKTTRESVSARLFGTLDLNRRGGSSNNELR